MCVFCYLQSEVTSASVLVCLLLKNDCISCTNWIAVSGVMRDWSDAS